MKNIEIQKIANKKSIHGVSLFTLTGSDGNGFYQQDAIRLIKEVEAEVIPIIGVDVYLLRNNKPTLTEGRDSWYCDRLKNEDLSHFTHRSCTSAIEYIQRYISKEGIPLFDIIIFDTNRIGGD